MNENKFDLTKYTLKGSILKSYFKLRRFEDEWYVFSGTIGSNRFEYFQTNARNRSEHLSNLIINERELNKIYTEEYYGNEEEFLELSENVAVVKEFGLTAYIRYWEHTFYPDDKLKISFENIHHFDALKEWFNLKLEQHTKKNEDEYITEQVGEADILNFQKKVIKNVYDFLKEGELSKNEEYSGISSAQANELNKFHKWLKEYKPNLLQYVKILKNNEDSRPILCNVLSIGKMLFASGKPYPEKMLDVFYGLVEQAKTIDDVPIQTRQRYNLKYNRYNFPYRESIYGAPILLDLWRVLHYKIDNVNEGNGQFKSYTKEIVYYALKDYARGFQKGFDDFLNDKIDSKMNMSSDEKNRHQRIIDFLIYYNQVSSVKDGKLSLSIASGLNSSPFSNWYKDGINHGHYYHCWYLIFENYKIFEPYFQKDNLFEKDINVIMSNSETKPMFDEEYVQPIFDVLKGFFNNVHLNELDFILKTGNDANEPLVFLDSGNRLADAFKQLFEAGIISGWQKKGLEEWIFKNFAFMHLQKIKKFKAKYLNDIISTNKDKCQKPILDITKDKQTRKYIIEKV